jgi:hypothetical protein
MIRVYNVSIMDRHYVTGTLQRFHGVFFIF